MLISSPCLIAQCRTMSHTIEAPSLLSTSRVMDRDSKGWAPSVTWSPVTWAPSITGSPVWVTSWLLPEACELAAGPVGKMFVAPGGNIIIYNATDDGVFRTSHIISLQLGQLRIEGRTEHQPAKTRNSKFRKSEPLWHPEEDLSATLPFRGLSKLGLFVNTGHIGIKAS